MVLQRDRNVVVRVLSQPGMARLRPRCSYSIMLLLLTMLFELSQQLRDRDVFEKWQTGFAEK